ncbi:MBL fold metallo-hydrolase [Candidatus Bathyarchaeota archaeon]|nr:MBL fold metallo-hydrolase [Candidatus Bathyarchaeota archaeon]
MLLKVIKSRGLAHNSYFLADGEEALVVDPRRDCTIYTQLGKRDCVKIKYILETHRNEDYVIGSLDLQNLTDAEIAHSKNTVFKYGEHNLSDGDTLTIEHLKIKALYTPGHTNDSVCYLVYDSMKSKDPVMVFTGDTLFVGDVGRTDLLGHDVWREQSEKLYHSLHDKVLPSGDHVIVYPAHGAGSICGHEISDREFSTIGYEKKTNPLLQLDREAFAEHLMKQKLLRPPYFRKMEQYNLNGPPLLHEASIPKPLGVNEFEEERRQPNTVIVDTREPGAFAGSYIPDSLNIWLDGLSFFPGWMLNYDQRILLVTERKEDIETAKAYLWRLGFDNIIGYLCPGLEEWRNNGKPVGHLGTLSAAMLKEKLDQNEIVVVDVREEHEWEEGHIEGAERIYVGHLKEEASRLPQDKPIATTCGWGGRGGLGASILKRMGFNDVYNVLGGMKAWKKLRYPVKKGLSNDFHRGSQSLS